jgi:predicted amidohydrolase YtcJ
MIDTLILGGNIHPINAAMISNGAVAIRNGRIVAVGAAASIKPLAGRNTRIITLNPAQTVVPGLIDSHQHLLSYVRSRTQLSLWDTTRLSDVLERLRQATTMHPPGTWIVAVGHDQGRLDLGRHPTRAELDGIAPAHPILVIRACAHIGIANSRALQHAKIDHTTADPDGGRFERDPHGEPTGVLLESALSVVRQSVVAPAIDWAHGIQSAVHEYHKRGITAVGEAALGHVAGIDDLRVIQQAMQAGVQLRMHAMAYGQLANALLAGEPLPAVPELAEYLTFGTIKYFIDGTLGGGTAYLTEEYRDEPGNRGWPIMPQEELEPLVERAHRAGFQVAVHAIGDAAVAMVTDIYERILLRFPRSNHRHRIEHVEVIHAGLAERMARLGLVAGIQSCFTYWESGDVTRLGPQLAPWGHAWHSLIQSGVVIANGSDNPVLPDFHPLQGMHAAVTRTTHTGLVLSPEQALSPAAALHSYTRGAAYASFQETHIGQITPGAYADLAILSADPCDPNTPAIRDIQVDATMIAGKLVFER